MSQMEIGQEVNEIEGHERETEDNTYPLLTSFPLKHKSMRVTTCKKRKKRAWVLQKIDLETWIWDKNLNHPQCCRLESIILDSYLISNHQTKLVSIIIFTTVTTCTLLDNVALYFTTGFCKQLGQKYLSTHHSERAEGTPWLHNAKGWITIESAPLCQSHYPNTQSLNKYLLNG